MSFSYDPSMASETDWVRRLIGDTVDTGHQLEDEEIAAFLDVEANRYYAAAAALESMLATWQRQGAGVTEKAVGRLRIRRGDSASAAETAKSLIENLRRRGAAEASPRPRVLRVL